MIERLRMIEDEHRREMRRTELARAARVGRVHRRSFGERLGRWLGDRR
jgi:hypothetical protein